MAEDTKPTPDPTILTTEQLLRETGSVEKLIDAKMNGMKSVVEEKFASVETQFELVERQRVEQKKDTKDAVDAALAAAKEAVKEQTTASDRSITKSETATAEQLKQIITTFTTANKSTDDKVDDLKTRVERIESVKQGGKDTLGGLYAFAAVAFAGIIAAIVLATYLATH